MKEEKIEILKDRVERLGFYSIIKVDTNNVILGGNQRFEVLKQLGKTEIEVLYPSRELTEKESDEIIITDNTHVGDFDYEILTSNFDADFLRDMDIPMIQNIVSTDEEIEEQEEKELFEKDIACGSETFQLYFTFPSEFKKKILKKLRENGKPFYEEAMLNLIVDEEE